MVLPLLQSSSMTMEKLPLCLFCFLIYKKKIMKWTRSKSRVGDNLSELILRLSQPPNQDLTYFSDLTKFLCCHYFGSIVFLICVENHRTGTSLSSLPSHTYHVFYWQSVTPELNMAVWKDNNVFVVLYSLIAEFIK